MKISKVKVKEYMSKQGIRTQTELANRMGITKNQLSVMLSGNYSPFKSNAVKLAEVLAVEPISLVDDNVDKFAEAGVEYCTDYTSYATAIEVFAGAGGIALGLEQAGIHTVKFVEIDKYCCQTLKRNRPHWNVVNEDISTVDFTPYRHKVDIVTGGSPCQSFSYSGKKLGLEDTRGTLFYQFARTIKEVEPLAFMYENVKGLVSHDKGRTFETILSVLNDLGYNIQYRVLNANDYGVAQKRQRLILIGTKPGVEFEYPEPQEYKPVLRDALRDVPVSDGQSYSEKKRKVLNLVPAGGCWIHLPDDIQKEYMGKSYYSGGGKRGMARRIAWEEPSLTLTCSPSQKQTERCHPDETRPFTVREYARIQTFSDDWEFAGGISAKYKQIGNAVPVELARRLGVQLKEAVTQYKKIKNAD